VAGKARNGGPAIESVSRGSFEAPLWAAADKLRGNMDAAEYKHVALGIAGTDFSVAAA
jgi:type I restriction enzyme M protein